MTIVPRATKTALAAACLYVTAALLAAQEVTGPEAPGPVVPGEARPIPGLPAGMSGFSDEGVFHVYLEDQRIGRIAFSWAADGTFENRYALSVDGQAAEVELKIFPDTDGRFQYLTVQSAQGLVTVERNGDRMVRRFNDEDMTLLLWPNTMMFENYSPALFAQALRAYDHEKGGQQSFPVFIIPRFVKEVVLEYRGSVERSIDGRDRRFRRYMYHVAGVEAVVWLDPDGKVCYADVPAQQAWYVREGFESLRKRPDADSSLSKPEHEVVEERSVTVPMRDGVSLSTAIFRPAGEGKFATLLVRTPYQKEMSELQGKYFARRGYAVAIQDCRGRFASSGTWEPFVNEGADGFDTIEWLAGQSWSTGKVGMIGGSYLGFAQWSAARERPPHLVTIIPNVSPSDPFFNLPYGYGVFFLSGALGWADALDSKATADLSGAAMGRVNAKKYDSLLRELPVIDLDEKVLGQRNDFWRTWIEHPANDDYWARAGFLDRLKDAAIPVFHQSGWFDGDAIGTKLNYLRMASHGHPHQKLIVGPWGPTAQSHRRVGERDFGNEAVIDLQSEYLRWFDYWLKGRKNAAAEGPAVKVFVMGTNRWMTGDAYPLPGTRFEKWYLDSSGGANTGLGNGRLSSVSPGADSPPDRYRYDPGDPTPSPYSLFGDPSNDATTSTKSYEEMQRARAAYHRSITDQRKDLLVFTTEPRTEPLTFVGPLSAVLYASSSARDTDWFVRLGIVEQDGNVWGLAEGKIRARYRQSTRTAEFLEPGKVYEYQIDLRHTGVTVLPGQRLCVEVASASFPTFSRNLNTGGHNEKDTEYAPADQTIYHNEQYPSHVLLPVIAEVK